MRPILLKGHTRPITCVKYNRDGDLLFTASKDGTPTLWYSDNGERVGTYDGHSGAVTEVDVSWDSKYLVSASADMSLKLWDVQTGEELCNIQHPGPVRSCQWSEGGHMFVSASAPFRGTPAAIFVYDAAEDLREQSDEPGLEIRDTGVKPQQLIQVVRWGALNKHIIAGGEDGSLRVFDASTGACVNSVLDAHTKAVTEITYNKDKTMFLSTSKDNTGKLWDAATLELLKVYQTDRPVNTAAFSPLKSHVALGGGQEAMDVTITAGLSGKFEVRFFHSILENQFGTVKGHFGPVNTLAFHPDGKSFCSGGEDGYIRLHHFDESYLTMDDFCDLQDDEEESKGAGELKTAE
jgi:translation initiation factor 3 subunit I